MPCSRERGAYINELNIIYTVYIHFEHNGDPASQLMRYYHKDPNPETSEGSVLLVSCFGPEIPVKRMLRTYKS